MYLATHIPVYLPAIYKPTKLMFVFVLTVTHRAVNKLKNKKI